MRNILGGMLWVQSMSNLLFDSTVNSFVAFYIQAIDHVVLRNNAVEYFCFEWDEEMWRGLVGYVIRPWENTEILGRKHPKSYLRDIY